MNWNFYIPHHWDTPTTSSEDIWLWPVQCSIEGNMGSKINLTVNALKMLLKHDNQEVVNLAIRLKDDDKAFWIWPFPDIEWGDEVSMIVNCTEFSKGDLLHFAQAYLEDRGFLVQGLSEASEHEAFFRASQ